MDVIGIICEYNPLHNGHLYHIEKIKETFPESIIVLVMSGPFTQRGDVSILSKWEKTQLALNHKIDLVIELPFKFASQSADIFAKGAIAIISELDCDYLVFGSETNNIDGLTKMAKMQIEDDSYNLLVKDYLSEGMNYPTAMSKAFADTIDIIIDKPNDILGLSYVKEIIKQKSRTKPLTIKRTNDYHDDELRNKIASATAIRKGLNADKEIKSFVPVDTYKMIKDRKEKDIFDFFKYKVLSEKKLEQYQTVDEGIDNRIKAVIETSNTLEEFLDQIKTKRYTYNRIKRMMIHILLSFTKKEAKNQKLNYIRVLGFNKQGLKHLNKVKKDISIPIVSNMKKIYNDLLELDIRAEKLYQLLNKAEIDSFKNAPIKKDLY